MTYVVYVHHTNNKAMVHHTACRKYKYRRADVSEYGHWSETFQARQDALNHARQTKVHVGECLFCIE
jgi:hypothetical protein